MFRTVTSDVSAVSSFVANSTSPCNTFPSPCLKLRTSGFPCLRQAGPVRLQTGIQPRPSPVSAGLNTRSAFTRPSPTYTWPKLLAQARAVACSVEHLSRGERGAGMRCLLNAAAELEHSFFYSIVCAFEEGQSSDDPDEDVVTRRCGAGTEADQVEEESGISGPMPAL